MVRGGLVSFIYEQTLGLNSASLSESASLTLMTADVERVGSGMRQMHEVWASIVEVGLALWLLEIHLGVATVAAIVVSLGMCESHKFKTSTKTCNSLHCNKHQARHDGGRSSKGMA
jgi:hypothetical protein